MMKQFYSKQFNARHLFAHSLYAQRVQFDPQIRPYQVLPLRLRVGQGVMAKTSYYIFPKVLGLEPRHQIV